MRARIFLLFSFLLPFAVTLSGQSKTYYINAKGADTNDGGAPERAWKTFARINQMQLKAGDKILLEGGATFIGQIMLTQEDAGTPENPIRIESYGAGKATIQNPDTSAISIINTGGIVINNLIINGVNRTKNKGSGVEILNRLPADDKRKYIRLSRLKISSFGIDGILLGGQPSDNSQSGFEDVEITNCEVYDNQQHGIFVMGYWDTNSKGYANKNVKIAHCVAHDNTGDPDFLENHSGSGIEVDDVENAVIEYCTAYNNGFLCNSRVGGPCGIWLHAANNSIIQYCVAINNRTGKGLDGAGFDLDGGTTNCIIQYCYARDNDGAGILIWNYEDAPHRLGDNILRFNILENNGRKNDYGDIHIGTSGKPINNIHIYNNTIFTSEQPGTNNYNIALTDGTLENFMIQNNLLIINGYGNGPSLLYIKQTQPTLRLESNIYCTTFKIGLQPPKKEIAKTNQLDYCENPLLSAWGTGEMPAAHVLQDLQGYRPLPASPLLQQGVVIKDKNGKILKDFGNQVVTKPFIGAFGRARE